MMGFGSDIKRIARQALVALLLIIAPPLGGCHWAAAKAAPSQPLADTANAGDLAVVSEASQQPPTDRDGEHRQGASRQAPECGICAAFATANDILLAPPPLLLLPRLIEFLYQATDAEFVHLKSIGLSHEREPAPAS